ncbi:hypothetical protein H0H10_26875 [Streptomyces sp. TRM S81-3]|uniref:Uncharacterized protein n=1 Tax=Streptomyces griseicoloratus TaxID=2752516 RepID=A0A926L518_9ACTN|nr:hypothetical protein [Streptomyces griseicoloratus]MBD0422732.1 hypothetical protein [Streptomyces griseicoloratus]
MDLPVVVGDVVTGSAIVLATGAVTGGTAWVGAKVRELLRRGTRDEQDAVIAALDDHEATPEERAERVAPLIQAHFDAYPAAIREFLALTMTGPTVYNQQNTGNGVFIGGDHHGNLTINQGREPHV